MPTGSTPDTLTQDALLQHRAFVRELAVSLMGQGVDAEDLEQEAWLTALRKRPGRVAELRPWLASVLRRLSWARRRQAGRHAAEELRSESVEAKDCGDPLERFEQEQRVVAAVMGLAEPYRSTLLLRYYSELGPEKIAARQGISVETVATRLRRGLLLLRGAIERELGTEDRARDLLRGVATTASASAPPLSPAWKLALPLLLAATGLLAWLGGAFESSRPVAPGPTAGQHEVTAELELVGGTAEREVGGRRTAIDVELALGLAQTSRWRDHGDTGRGEREWLRIERLNAITGVMVEGGRESSLDCQPPARHPLAGARVELPADTATGAGLVPPSTPTRGEAWSIAPADFVRFLCQDILRTDEYEVAAFELVQGSFARGTDQWFDASTGGRIRAVRTDAEAFEASFELELEGGRDLRERQPFAGLATAGAFELDVLETRTTLRGSGSFRWDPESKRLVRLDLDGTLEVEESFVGRFPASEQTLRRRSFLAGPLRVRFETE